MSRLTDLLQQGRTNLGNWTDLYGTFYNLPEFGISEAIAAEPTVNTQPQQQPISYTSGGGSTDMYSPNVATTSPTGTAPSGDTGGSPSPSGGDPSGGDGKLVENAKSAYDIAKEAIISRLGMMKEEANRLRTSAKGKYDFASGEIGKNYGALKDLSAEKLKSAYGYLDQEDVGVQNLYGRSAGNSRRAMESALTRNRMLHRAMGSLGSSFYTNAQGDTTNQGMNAVNDLGVEETGKRAQIGTRRSETGIQFAHNDLAIGAEETSLKNQALTDYNEAIGNADLLEKNYNIDSTEAIGQANNQLTSALGQIREYVMSKYQDTANSSLTDSTSGAGANFVKQYDASGGGLRDTLNTAPSVDSSDRYIAGAGNVGVPQTGGSNISWLNTLRRTPKKEEEDPTGYFQNYV